MTSTGSSTSSSYNFTFNWSVGDFSKCSKSVVKSPYFSPPPPFNHINWKLWLHPNGLDPRSRGYLAVQLEMVNNGSDIDGGKLDNEPKSSSSLNGNSLKVRKPGHGQDTARPLKLTSASVIYKIGIINAANKMIDSCLEEEDFVLKPLSKVKLFMRNRLIMINCREAQSIMNDDILTLRCEVTYSESLLRQIVPSFDVSEFIRLLDHQKLTDVTIQVNEEDDEEEDMVYEYDGGHGNLGKGDNQVVVVPSAATGLDGLVDDGHVTKNQGITFSPVTFADHVSGNAHNNNTQVIGVKGQELIAPVVNTNSTVHAHHNQSSSDYCIKEIKAHKVLLAARSPVFESMLTNGMMESSSNVIEVSDIDYEVMKEMIDFMYTGFVSNLSKYALDLLFAAEKYHLAGLKVICENYLKSHLNQDNVVSVLLAADLLNLTGLRTNCIQLICSKIKDMNKCNQTWMNLLAKESPDLFKQIQLKCGS